MLVRVSASGLDSRLLGLRFRVWGVGSESTVWRALGLESRVLGSRVLGFKVEGLSWALQYPTFSAFWAAYRLVAI